MRLALTVLIFCFAYATSFPTLHEHDDEALEAEIRSILNHLEEQETRSIDSDEQEENSFQMAKRQGGHNIIDQQSKCEILCIGKERKAETGGGKSVAAAAKICKNKCNAPSKKSVKGKKPVKGKATKRSFLNLREEDEDEDESQSNSDEDQQRREFFDLLQEQLENNNNDE